jgi:hypothetical protein
MSSLGEGCVVGEVGEAEVGDAVAGAVLAAAVSELVLGADESVFLHATNKVTSASTNRAEYNVVLRMIARL